MPGNRNLRCSLFAGSMAFGGLAGLSILAAGEAMAQTSLYPPQHMCAHPATQGTPVCQALNEAMTVPANNAAARPVFQPHRGVWGGPGSEGPAENTIGAMQNVVTEGYRIVELDFMFADTAFKQGKTYPDGDQIAMSHYFDMYAFGGESEEQARDIGSASFISYDPAPVPRILYSQRKRDMTLSGASGDRVASFRQALQFAKQNNLILGVDVKTDDHAIQQPVGSPPAGQEQDFEYAALIAGVLHEAKAQSALGWLVIKSDRTLDHIIRIMAEQRLMDGTTNGWDYYFNNFDGKFLWAPIVNKKINHDQNRTLGRIKGLYEPNCRNSSGILKLCHDKRAIFSIEVQVFNPVHWTAQTINYDGVIGDNLLDYVIDYTAAKSAVRRPSSTIIEPMGALGTLGRVYNWKFIGNVVDADAEEDSVGGIHEADPALDDLRSDPTFYFGLKHARRSIIMTDRPDVYEGPYGMLK